MEMTQMLLGSDAWEIKAWKTRSGFEIKCGSIRYWGEKSEGVNGKTELNSYSDVEHLYANLILK